MHSALAWTEPNLRDGESRTALDQALDFEEEHHGFDAELVEVCAPQPPHSWR